MRKSVQGEEFCLKMSCRDAEQIT
ncbi:hypothetical protein KGM_203281 [Danaus plexippus plexippus]|uniref:Uncharacterized protein n=1 Tax=Danaus plexippus plexippus TaxID=278856 RepID=A0A212EW92_DANPL|nr:hypothetical protein KGM_203281 [Danaus plexippus plexippus]